MSNLEIRYLVVGTKMVDGHLVPAGRPKSQQREAWSAFLERLRESKVISDKASIDLFVPGPFCDKPIPNVKGSTLLNENIGCIDFLVFDIEGGGTPKNPEAQIADAELEELRAWLKARPFETVFFNSFSDGLPGKGRRGRILVPISTPIVPDDYGQARHSQSSWWHSVFRTLAKHVLGKWYDHPGIRSGLESAKDLRRAYYFRASPPPSAGGAAPWFDHNNSGNPLNAHPYVQNATELRADVPETSFLGSGLGIDEALLKKTLRKWDQSTNPQLRSAALAMRKVLAGDEWSERGAGHQTIVSLTFQLALAFRPFDPKAVVAQYFLPSCQLWGDFERTRANVEEAFTSALRKLDAQDKGKLLEQEKEHVETLKAVGRSGDYTPEELQRLRTFGPWILSLDGKYWFLRLDEKGEPEYVGPKTTPDGAAQYAAQIFAPAKLRCWNLGDDGRKLRTIRDMRADFGRELSLVQGSLALERTVYNEQENSLTLAHTPLCIREPKFSPDIDTYLKIVAGVECGRLLDYLTMYPDLNRLLPALVLLGPKDHGKTFLARCLASVWSRSNNPQPTTLKNLLSTHPDGLLKSPVVLADEYIPRDFRQRPRTEEMRELITAKNHEVNQKYGLKLLVEGYCRVVISINDLKLLAGDDAESRHAQKASIDRFFLLEFPPAAEAFLKSTPYSRLSEWLEGDFAAHIFHLVSERKVEKAQGRWWVRPSGGEKIAEVLSVSTTSADSVCSWIYGFLEDPATLYTRVGGDETDLSVRVVNVAGRYALRVRPRTIFETWGIYARSTPPRYGALMSALRNLASSSARQKLTMPGRGTMHAYDLDLAKLSAWSEQHEIPAEDFLELLREAATVGNEHAERYERANQERSKLKLL